MTKKQFCSTKIFGVMIYNTSFVISATQMQTSDTAFVLFCGYEWVIAQMGKTHPSGFTEKKRDICYLSPPVQQQPGKV